MPLLLIAGVPHHKYNKMLERVIEFPGWDVNVISASTGKPLLTHCWEQVTVSARDASQDGVHILAFHSDERGRKQYEAPLGEKWRRLQGWWTYARHRLVWLPTELADLYETDDFKISIEPYVKFEEEWREEIRPNSLHHPLFLPELIFSAHENVKDVWVRAQLVSRHEDTLDGVKGALSRFRKRHKFTDRERNTSLWRDTRSWLFNPKGPQHGLAGAIERTWKYTCKLPNGFHFDVSTERGNQFSVVDLNGVALPVGKNEYINVDCHGFCRPGSVEVHEVPT